MFRVFTVHVQSPPMTVREERANDLDEISIRLAEKEPASRPDIIITPARIMLPPWPFTLKTN